MNLTSVNAGIDFRLMVVDLLSELDALQIEVDGALEIEELAIRPAEPIRDARQNEALAVELGDASCLLHGVERLAKAAMVTE
jgi:hypothetical protein